MMSNHHERERENGRQYVGSLHLVYRPSRNKTLDLSLLLAETSKQNSPIQIIRLSKSFNPCHLISENASSFFDLGESPRLPIFYSGRQQRLPIHFSVGIPPSFGCHLDIPIRSQPFSCKLFSRPLASLMKQTVLGSSLKPSNTICATTIHIRSSIAQVPSLLL
jgi:hypothetical protein